METTLIIVGGVLIGCFLGLSWFAGTDAPYVPTKNERIKKILKLAGLKKGQFFWELGSGDGRIVLEAARMGAISYGVEQSWIRVLYSKWKAKKMQLKNTHFIHGDIFSVIPAKAGIQLNTSDSKLDSRFRGNDIRKADIVFIFLLPKGVEKLEPILKKNLKKEAKVITQTFHFKNWKPYKKVLISDKTPNTLLGKNKYEGDFWLYRL